jgi:hypothetical protein
MESSFPLNGFQATWQCRIGCCFIAQSRVYVSEVQKAHPQQVYQIPPPLATQKLPGALINRGIVGLGKC